jgi:hypothetical protein
MKLFRSTKVCPIRVDFFLTIICGVFIMNVLKRMTDELKLPAASSGNLHL